MFKEAVMLLTGSGREKYQNDDRLFLEEFTKATDEINDEYNRAKKLDIV